MKNLIVAAFPSIHDSNLLTDMTEAAIIQTFKKGDIVKNKNTFFSFFYVVLMGSMTGFLAIDPDKSKAFYFVNRGEVCTTSLLFGLTHKKNNLKIIAEQDVTLLCFPTESVREWSNKHAAWREYMWGNFHQRYEDVLIHNLVNVDVSLEDKLTVYLRRKAQRLDTQTLELTHQEIADDFATAREVISRTLKRLEKKQSIKLSRSNIELLLI